MVLSDCHFERGLLQEVHRGLGGVAGSSAFVTRFEVHCEGGKCMITIRFLQFS